MVIPVHLLSCQVRVERSQAFHSQPLCGSYFTHYKALRTLSQVSCFTITNIQTYIQNTPFVPFCGLLSFILFLGVDDNGDGISSLPPVALNVGNVLSRQSIISIEYTQNTHTKPHVNWPYYTSSCSDGPPSLSSSKQSCSFSISAFVPMVHMTQLINYQTPSLRQQGICKLMLQPYISPGIPIPYYLPQPITSAL